MSLESLSKSVQQASRCYSSVAAVYQWVAEGKLPGAPCTTHTYPDLVRVFSGSCLEQIRKVAMLGYRFNHYLRSTRREKNGTRSGHYAAVCPIDGERYLIDPNLGLPPINLDELWHQGEISVVTIPHLGNRHMNLVVQPKPRGVIEVGKAIIGEECVKNLGGESFDISEKVQELPGAGFDVRTPLHEGQLKMDVAVPIENIGVEVVRIQKGEKGFTARPLGEGGRFPEDHGKFDQYLNDVATTCGVEAHEVKLLLNEGWELFRLLRKQRDALIGVIKSMTGATTPESLVNIHDLTAVENEVRSRLGVLCFTEQMQGGDSMKVHHLADRIYEVGDWSSVKAN